MSANKLLRFTVGDDGELLLEAAEGHALEIVEQGPHFLRVRTSAALGANNKAGRSAAFDKAAEIGDVMPDGTIYVGISPLNNRHMFIAAKGVPEALSPGKAREYVYDSDAHGHTDWHLSSVDECAHMFRHRNEPKIGEAIRTRHYWAIDDEGRPMIMHVRSQTPLSKRASTRFFIPVRYGDPAPGK